MKTTTGLIWLGDAPHYPFYHASWQPAREACSALNQQDGHSFSPPAFSSAIRAAHVGAAPIGRERVRRVPVALRAAELALSAWTPVLAQPRSAAAHTPKSFAIAPSPCAFTGWCSWRLKSANCPKVRSASWKACSACWGFPRALARTKWEAFNEAGGTGTLQHAAT
jgi:hypothetical protein